jgi:hypothetical protein
VISWRILPEERSETYSPIGLLVIDDFTSRPAIGIVEARLDLSDGGGGWIATDIKARLTLGGVLSYPGLERRAEVLGLPPQNYRVRLIAEFYRPIYRLNAEGIEFEAFPYNDTNPPTDYRVNPPQVITPQPQDVKLAPAVNYPFPTHVRVLRGNVVDASGRPVIDAEVKRGLTERVLSGERGAYALPLRWTPNGVAVSIDAIDHRTGRTGTINITLPQALGSNQTITVS